jgi:hypothetical protein
VLVTPGALARSPYAAVVVSGACVLQEPAPVDKAPAAQTGAIISSSQYGLALRFYSVKLKSSTRAPGTRLLPVER